ncbi:sensor histidine kinase [Nocardia sp. alder85J]|uniref:sensor histidine kinase n=1 Tax=Nocardia sp. alder85J TaxID=2862949 RepID=UPI001CD56F7F|nr:HAMP domain-containing sensor histidine kinase [Nocardia sp. alder85J]MCX4094174.1 HAMP domain-containing sensor histidine kinase [Nocardia sp. alder85J]
MSPARPRRARRQRPDPRPAVARLRRARRVLTALFTAITAICLIALGAFAVTVDAHSRQRALDDRIDRYAGGLAREVSWTDDGSVDVGGLRDDDLTQDTVAIVVLARDRNQPWREVFAHRRAGLPTAGALVTVADDIADSGDPSIRTMPDSTGRPARLMAVPVWPGDDSFVGAVVLAAADPAPAAHEHRNLVLALEIGCAALVVLAAAAGHALSGVSMRSALRLLDEQERFLADAAHELRTPLAALRLRTDAGLRDCGGERVALTDVRRLTDRMARLVAGLLARARTETGVAEPERLPLRLDQLVEGVIEDFAPAHLRLTAEPAVVEADPELLALAVRNLVDNALVHGGGGPVEVAVTPSTGSSSHTTEEPGAAGAPDARDLWSVAGEQTVPKAGVMVVTGGRVTVRDFGPGLDPALTDPFDRGATASRRGHGIGLSIVRWVAGIHDGTATLEPAPDRGTIATITIGLPGRTPRRR